MRNRLAAWMPGAASYDGRPIVGAVKIYNLVEAEQVRALLAYLQAEGMSQALIRWSGVYYVVKPGMPRRRVKDHKLKWLLEIGDVVYLNSPPDMSSIVGVEVRTLPYGKPNRG